MTQSLKNLGDAKKSIFYGTPIFERVTANKKYSHRNTLMGNLVTYNLVFISCGNSNFEGHQSNFSDERSNLPKVI